MLGRWGEMGPEPRTLSSGSPGADARSPGARICQPSQARGSRRGRVRGFRASRSGIGGRRRRPACHPPPNWQSQAGAPIALAAGRFPLQPAARPVHPTPAPEGRYLGPRPLGASRQRSERPSSSLNRRQRQQKARERGGGAQEPVLPAVAAASRNSNPRFPRAPQRSAAAGASGRRQSGHRHRQRPLSLPLPFREPSPQNLGIWMMEGAVASLCFGRVRDGASESPFLNSLGSFIHAHLLGNPLLGSATEETPPLLSRGCSTYP